MQVFKLLEVPLKWIPLIINSIIEFTVSMKRIHQFLICKEMNPQILSIKKFEAFNEKDILIENANFTWGGPKNEKQIKGIEKSEDDLNATKLTVKNSILFRKLNLTINEGEFI